MKISRGSNIEGYAGIKEESIVDNIHIIRTLLYFKKEELVKYNQNKKEKNIEKKYCQY